MFRIKVARWWWVVYVCVCVFVCCWYDKKGYRKKERNQQILQVKLKRTILNEPILYDDYYMREIISNPCFFSIELEIIELIDSYFLDKGDPNLNLIVEIKLSTGWYDMQDI